MKSKLFLRWIALVAVFLNIVVNYYSNIRPFNNKTMADVSNENPTLFTPAGYAFSIWGLIYLSLVIYVISSLFPGQKDKDIFDRLSLPLIVISMLSLVWVIIFSYELYALSVLIIAIMLVLSLILFVRANNWVLEHNKDKWLKLPFGLYAGWLTVATIAAVSVWLYHMGWRGGMLSEADWAIILLIVTLIIGIAVSCKTNNFVYPMVISWAAFAIWVARRDDYEMVATVAFAVASVLTLWSIGFAVKIYKRN
jgi:hypothetical protein